MLKLKNIRNNLVVSSLMGGICAFSASASDELIKGNAQSVGIQNIAPQEIDYIRSGGDFNKLKEARKALGDVAKPLSAVEVDHLKSFGDFNKDGSFNEIEKNYVDKGKKGDVERFAEVIEVRGELKRNPTFREAERIFAQPDGPARDAVIDAIKNPVVINVHVESAGDAHQRREADDEWIHREGPADKKDHQISGATKPVKHRHHHHWFHKKYRVVGEVVEVIPGVGALVEVFYRLNGKNSYAAGLREKIYFIPAHIGHHKKGDHIGLKHDHKVSHHRHHRIEGNNNKYRAWHKYEVIKY